MSKVIVGENLEEELGNIVKMLEKELQNIYDRVYDLLEHWGVGETTCCGKSLYSIMEMVAANIRHILEDQQKEALKEGIVSSEQVKIAVKLAVENWFNDKLKVSLEKIK